MASSYDIATTDGINEAGLVGNVLYLAEAQYGPLDWNTGRAPEWSRLHPPKAPFGSVGSS